MSDEYDTGAPRKMRASCTNCGQRYYGGIVTVWLEKGPDGYLSQPRDDVSFLCTKGCEEVHDMEITVLKRAEN